MRQSRLARVPPGPRTRPPTLAAGVESAAAGRDLAITDSQNQVPSGMVGRQLVGYSPRPEAVPARVNFVRTGLSTWPGMVLT
jgi:hypothetical protein